MRKLYLFLIGVIILLAGTSFVSAALCIGSDGYYTDCSDNAPFNHRYQGPKGQSSASYYNYNNYNSGSSSGNSNTFAYNTNSNSNSDIVPIFKGPYGNYRYAMYQSGDYKPPIYFGDSYGLGYGYPFFGGGYVGYGGYGYPFFGGGYYNYYSPYSQFGYSRSYSPIYYSIPYFNTWF